VPAMRALTRTVLSADTFTPPCSVLVDEFAM
jgi:hypothetical protein